ncbi:site-specific DNA-methyltransferase [Flavobacterium galactosidilyticum]|uniref:DNA methyltransferase n=1 Tax=Flavobacterium galactosidilyticum TaxID=2893886 RepID=UPI001E501488|nr:DNA methyltransferase [Flavobacterium sp. F-340]UFH47360.1 site-specific DNA-methyltransferase [Flavobacterium sp. F-340]
MITITREDNMELMARYPDNYFDLAIVDPPYGILNKTKRGGDRKFNMEEYSQWDVKPNDEYFNELIRVSKNQIIWGGNYFGQLWLRSEYNKGFIIWDKNQPETLNNFSMAEMAWSSLDKPSKIFRYSVRKNRNKIHPTQKPVELYEWLLKMYAKQNDKILDTHLGSGTIAIACYNAGLSLTACEISETYYLKSLEKIKEVIPESSIHTDDLDTFSLTFPEQTKSENGLYKQYKEQVEQLRLFKEERTKYYASVR